MYNDIGALGIDITDVWQAKTLAVLAVVAVCAYLIGNISPSILIARAHGIDIKKEGSGNAGTTNVLRVLGKKAAAATLIIDILKGTVAVVLAGLLVGSNAAMVAALASFCGHVWPVFFGFKGGKGVATAFGAICGIHPGLGFSCLGVVLLIVLITKRMSAGSLAAALSFPVLCWFFEPRFIWLGSIMALIILVKHRENIARLARGEEPKLSFKK
jgi:glycerol-3-phosphate acyltransferase PlsY